MHGIVNKSLLKKNAIFDEPISSIAVISSTMCWSTKRFFSSIRPLANSEESLALDCFNNEKPANAFIINKILLNQNLSVTDTKLEKLLKVKGVELDLPISMTKDKQLLDELTGKSPYKGFSGVYIFIHKSTGNKYVGSSNLLRRRMDYYFKGNFPLGGKFLPLLHKEGLKAFKLIIFKLDRNIFNYRDALILEQYYLLNKEFNLNTLRIVNAGSSTGNPIYVYDLKCSTLYYHAKSSIELKKVLKVHPITSKKYVDSKMPYLNRFLLLSHPIPTALTSNTPVDKLVDIMKEERKDMYRLGTRRSIPVELVIKDGNTFVNSDFIGQTLKFDSLTSCIEYLRKSGLTIKRDTLTNYIKNEKEFDHFLCKYSENILPDNFSDIGLIINEYKKLKLDPDSGALKVNRKNKSILVKNPGENFKENFESITDTIKYFATHLNIKLDRKTLYLRLKDGKKYKDYSFFYK